jgi:uncharacterized membrane protein required for colicin V production
VPQIDTPLLLDILLGLVVLLFVPFGVRRGVAKEAMVSAGILLGATLAARFGETWGAELAQRFPLERGAATFTASVAILFASTLLLGYGGGAALGAMRVGMLSRLVGGLLAAFNAALLLSYLLAWIDQFLGQGGILDDGIVGRALLRQANLLLLGAAGILLALTVLGWIVNLSRSRRQPHGGNGTITTGIPARQRPVRMAGAADAGKHEPDVDLMPRSGRFASGLDATSPLPSGSSFVARHAWPGDGHAVQTTNGRSNGIAADRPWGIATDETQVPSDDTVWAAWNTSAGHGERSQSETTGQWPAPSASGVTADDRCAVCRARVGPRDVFCPECGATL